MSGSKKNSFFFSLTLSIISTWMPGNFYSLWLLPKPDMVKAREKLLSCHLVKRLKWTLLFIFFDAMALNGQQSKENISKNIDFSHFARWQECNFLFSLRRYLALAAAITWTSSQACM